MPCQRRQRNDKNKLYALHAPQAQCTGKAKQVVVDLGYRGKEVDAANAGVEIIHRGRYKTMSKHERKLLKPRQAVEPAIEHLKAVYRMSRCWLKGVMGAV